MAIRRMDHVGIVVDDLDAATGFFAAIGLTASEPGVVSGDWVDRIIGVEGARSRVVFLSTPDGHSSLELTQFLSPVDSTPTTHEPSNRRGIRHLCFAVDSLDETLERVREQGFGLVGTIEQYENIYRLCYVRGPEGIIVELAEELPG